MSLTADTADTWLQRWDQQQEHYIVDREERFAVIADVVEASADRPDPLIVDLGCGPGSLDARLLDRLPGAEIIGVDADPLLLALAQARYGERGGLRFVDHDLTKPGWVEALDISRPVDAVVSTTALHWLTDGQLRFVYASAARLLRPGGVLVNGDHLHASDAEPALGSLLHTVRQQRAQRAGQNGAGEDWQAWWEAATLDPALSPLITERSERAIAHHGEGETDYAGHLEALRHAGFSEAGTVWQSGDDRVLVALR